MFTQAIVCTVPSDSHTWNLIYMQLLLEEYGINVINLGCCVPAEELVKQCHKIKPDMVVISTINGHGYMEGKETLLEIKKYEILNNIEFFIGGKLTVNGELKKSQISELINLGFQGVFTGKDSVNDFINIISNKQPKLRSCCP